MIAATAVAKINKNINPVSAKIEDLQNIKAEPNLSF
jgi:hypothetical protein